MSDIEQDRKKAQMVGRVMARKLFQSRGGHSEIHLSQKDVMVLISAGVWLSMGHTSELYADDAQLEVH